MSTRRPRRGKVGLALAGGGPQGAIYEIGALTALSEAVGGLDLNDLDIYVGVSAGGFLAACLANGITPAELCRGLLDREVDGERLFTPKTFFSPPIGHWLRSGARAPRLLLEAVQEVLAKPHDQSWFGALSRLGQALPVGLFDNEPIRAFLHWALTRPGRSDDFRRLERKLVIVAADLDSGEAVRFGAPGLDHVPISQAVQASSALPGLYPPVLIDGRYYVDGVLLKTLHASVALEEHTGLLLCINPIAPIDTAQAAARGYLRRGKLVDRGLPTVLSQTFRTLIHSRMRLGFANYKTRFPQADVALLEPARDDYQMFFTRIFSFSSRKATCEHAYQATRAELWRRRAELRPLFARHGLRLREDLLKDRERSLWDAAGLAEPRPLAPVSARLDRALDRVEQWLNGARRPAAR